MFLDAMGQNQLTLLLELILYTGRCNVKVRFTGIRIDIATIVSMDHQPGSPLPGTQLSFITFPKDPFTLSSFLASKAACKRHHTPVQVAYTVRSALEGTS